MAFKIMKAGAIYFLLVFAVGFFFGTLRVLWLVTRVGTRAAELIETPFMLTVIFLVARWLVGRFGSNVSKSGWLAAGVIALALLLVAEFTIVLVVQGMSVADYMAQKDPISGSVYLISLGLFAIMPALLAAVRVRDT
jgi:hypothetical protein